MRRAKPMRGVAAIISLVLAVASPARAQSEVPESEIVLPVTINGVPAGETSVILKGDDVYVPVTTLQRGRVTGVSWERVLTVARLRNAERVLSGEPAISLRSLAPWTTFEVNETDLTLSITIDPTLLGGSSIALQNARPADIIYSTDKSTFLNYAVTSSGFSDVGAFAEVGSSVGGNLLYTGLSAASGFGVTRGLTNYTIDQRHKLRRIIAGDATVVGDELGGSGVVGGVTVARSFELDPYFIRFPSLSLRGVALTPSEVETYVNGVLVDRRTVPPGPFEIGNVPASSGTSGATVVVRDAFGREQTHASSFYYSTGVLGRGLSEYNYSAGVVREPFGSFDYGDPIFFAAHRYGMTDNITIGGRLEATSSIVSGGPSLALASRFGEVDLKVAGSSGDGHSGVAGQLGFRRLTRRTNVAATIRMFSREYENFSLPADRDRSLRDMSLFASYLPRWGSIGLQWSSSQMRDAGDRQRLTALANVGVGDRASVLMSAAAVEENGVRFGEYFLGLSVRARGNATLNLSTHSRDGVNRISAELQRPTPVGTGWGYRLQSSTSQGEAISLASVQYQNDFGRYEIDADPQNLDEFSATAAGAVVYQDGTIAAMRPVSQSFALVRVPSVPGVRVYLSNQLVGRTDARGELLIPNLLPYYGNRIRIDDRDVPMTHDIQVIERTIAPPSRGGALVIFPAREIHAATGSVVVRTAEGDVVPKYGEITVQGNEVTAVSPIGGEGDFYFENVSPGPYQAVIEYERGQCTFSFQIPSSSDEVTDIGRVVCSGVTP